MQLWRDAGIGPPSSDMFVRASNGIPFHQIQFLIKNCLGHRTRTGIPLFSEQHTIEILSLKDMYGCTHSKSPCGDFNAMRVARPIADEAAAATLANTIFAGRDDCIARQDEHADVIRQGWDGRQWFRNYGGSHRAAALHAFDQDRGIDRPIHCNVITVSPSPDLIALAETHHLFLVKNNNPERFYDLCAKFALPGSDIRVRQFNDNKHFSIQLPRDTTDERPHILHTQGGIDILAWALDPRKYAFDQKTYLIFPDLNPSPALQTP